jgi:hypothetical protein
MPTLGTGEQPSRSGTIEQHRCVHDVVGGHAALRADRYLQDGDNPGYESKMAVEFGCYELERSRCNIGFLPAARLPEGSTRPPIQRSCQQSAIWCALLTRDV